MVLAESTEVQQQSGGALRPQEQSVRRHRRRTPTAAAQPLLSSQVTTTRQQSTQSSGGNVTLRPGFAHDRTLVLGVIQLLSGVAAVILSTVAIASEAWGYYIGAGIWSGAFFIASGIIGIICSKKKDNCTIISFLVLSIISAVVALMLVGFSVAGIVVDFINQTHLKNSQVMVVHSLILVIAFIQGICAIVSSSICCKTVCCQGIMNPPPYGYPYCPEGQQIAIFQPHPGRSGGIFSLPHGAYIIQPAESGNNQILYMLPAPETIRHNLPPPPYYSRERLDNDEDSVPPAPQIIVASTPESNAPPSPAPPYNSLPNVSEMNSLNSHNTSQGSIQVIPVVDPNMTLEIAPPSVVTENLETYESPRITMGQESEENKP